MSVVGDLLRVIAGLLAIVLVIGTVAHFIGVWPTVALLAASALIGFATGAYR